jgi:hypothetical protein
MSKSSVAVACFLPGRAKDLSAPLYKRNQKLFKASVRLRFPPFLFLETHHPLPSSLPNSFKT